MVTFKVGDRVRLVGTGYTFDGSEGTVTGFFSYYVGVNVRVDHPDANRGLNNSWPCNARELRLLPNRPAVSRILSLTPATKKVVGHLEKVGTISPMEAQVVLGLPKVAKQVWEARQHGWNVKTEYKKDASGKRYARYSLAA